MYSEDTGTGCLRMPRASMDVSLQDKSLRLELARRTVSWKGASLPTLLNHTWTCQRSLDREHPIYVCTWFYENSRFSLPKHVWGRKKYKWVKPLCFTRDPKGKGTCPRACGRQGTEVRPEFTTANAQCCAVPSMPSDFILYILGNWPSFAATLSTFSDPYKNCMDASNAPSKPQLEGLASIWFRGSLSNSI